MRTSPSACVPAYKKTRIKLLRRAVVMLIVAIVLTPLLGQALAAVARSLSAHP
ncbi:MAG: hypothetical protein LBH01_11235 [Verrucomicrobiales bacterium]|jgi:hypothetical protein|nr:hypothetical protein [Verrucomicrobiales bacterium]